jgi:predicted DNA-binding antitoxin AbrB/MazE fold protein
MTIRARYSDGVLLPLEPLELVEGSEVEIEIRTQDLAPDPAEIIARISKLVVGNAPSDGGINHDHYLYGAPKRVVE